MYFNLIHDDVCLFFVAVVVFVFGQVVACETEEGSQARNLKIEIYTRLGS